MSSQSHSGWSWLRRTLIWNRRRGGMASAILRPAAAQQASSGLLSHFGWCSDRLCVAATRVDLCDLESLNKCRSGSRAARKQIMTSGAMMRHLQPHTGCSGRGCTADAQRACQPLARQFTSALLPSQVLILCFSFWCGRTLGYYYNWTTLALGKVCMCESAEDPASLEVTKTWLL